MTVWFEGRLATRTTPQSAIDNWRCDVPSDRVQKLDPAGVKSIPPPAKTAPPPPPPSGGSRSCDCKS